MRGVEDREDDDPREAEAKVLPTHEALSLIAPDSLSDYDVVPDTDAAASGRGEESVASDDRTPPASA